MRVIVVLVFFGVCIGVGYVALWLALEMLGVPS